jgi:hypothetical protein
MFSVNCAECHIFNVISLQLYVYGRTFTVVYLGCKFMVIILLL